MSTTGSLSYQIVVFTSDHMISGNVFLRDQRLSDFLNDRRENNIVIRHANIARLQNPSQVLQKCLTSVVPKKEIVLAFDPPQKHVPLPRRFIAYPKERYGIFIVQDGLEIRGEIHVAGQLDLLYIMADAADMFLPVTKATVTIQANPKVLLESEAVMVNVRRICFIGQIDTSKLVSSTS
ncbi:MAG: hypothetical protein N2049_05145 [Anaerolineales bacterium]|nr:hypothetical protein [Anaerolineales bacterium]MCX7608588.1 hypothetical protein [Anaerolineales bacterium]MDW8226651.1 hypothetical protein [Anaerolineales bacterium]